MTHKVNGFRRSFSASIGRGCCLLTVLGILATPLALMAQTAGEGTITGTVRDSTGAVVAGATVTATDAATNVSTSRDTSSAGDYTIAPLPPGIYSVKVTAKGFKSLTQENLAVDALVSLGFNPVLTIGEATETVVVTSAPPVMDTTNATLGLVMENSTYANLPLQMNAAQRDPTAGRIPAADHRRNWQLPGATVPGRNASGDDQPARRQSSGIRGGRSGRGRSVSSGDEHTAG